MAVVGETLTSTTGTFTGGTGDVTVADTIKKSETGSDSWVNATTGNSYVLTAEDDGWYFRATSRATDSAEPANTLNNHSNVLGPVTTPISYEKLVVSAPVLTGEPLVGYTLTCPEPTITGGSGEVQVAYYWQDANNSRVLYMGSTQQVKDVDIGRTIQCQVVVTDAKADEVVTVVSNSVGPINRPALTEFDVWVNGELHEDPSADVGVAPGGQVMLEVRPQPSATAPADVVYKWALRTGTGRLSGDENSRGIVYIAPEEPPAGAVVTCTAMSTDADDSAYAAEVTILVAE